MPVSKHLPGIGTADKIISDYLFHSDFYEIKNWAFDFTGQQLSKGYNDCFCIVFIKKGNFNIDLSRRSYQMHTGHIVVEKADYEYQMRPATGECSIFNFTPGFYEQFINDYSLQESFFFANANLLSLLLNASPEMEYLHYQVLKGIATAGKLEMDNMVLELVRQIVGCITDQALETELPEALRKNHIRTVEMAKEYMNEHFASDISLKDLAAYCCISPFHFSRVFKKFTSYSPHQYLLNIRLKHAQMLVRNTSQPVSDVCFSSGFNSLDYFSTAFKQKYKMSPTRYRKE